MVTKQTKPTKQTKITSKFTEVYDFEIGSHVIYTSGLYEELKGKEAIVISRTNQRNKIYYVVRFIDDNTEKTMMQSVLKLKC